MPRPIAPYVRTSPVVTGHFVVGPEYASYRPRGTEDHLLILTGAGGGRFDGPDGAILTHHGDLHLCRPGVLHDYRTDPSCGTWELWWAHFTPDPDWMDLLNWPVVGNDVMHLHADDAATWADILALWQRSHRAALSADPLRDRLALNAVETLLLTSDACNPRRRDRRSDPLVRLAIEHVTNHLGHPHSVETLADHVGLSVSRFAHRFKHVMHAPPASFVETCRIQRASQLLVSTSLEIKEIAAQLGFGSQFYFSLRFKKRTGQSPTAYRRQAGNK